MCRDRRERRRLGILIASLATLALWLRHELHTPSPLIDVRLLGHRQLALANIGVVLLALGPLQSGLLLSLLLQQPQWTGVGLGLSATLAGVILAPPMALAVLIGPGCGLLAARFGARTPALLACAFLLVGWGGIALEHASLPFVVAMVVLQGIGMAMAYAAAPMLIVEVAPASRTSEVTGVSSVVRYIFNAVGSQVIALLLAHETVSNPAAGPGVYPAPSAFALTLSVISLLCMCGLMVTWALPRRGGRAAQAAPAELSRG